MSRRAGADTRRTMRRGLPRLLILCVVGLSLGGAGVSAAAASPARRPVARAHRPSRPRARHLRHGAKRTTARRRGASPRASAASRGTSEMTQSPGGLRFGVYPWAAPGAVSLTQPQLADDPAQALTAVRALKGQRTLTVHLYGQFTGAGAGEADALVSDATWWSENGLRVEMVLRYRPARPDLGAAYVPWVRNVATRLSALPGLAALQIGNEPNNMTPAAGDGSYPGVIAAIAHGIPAARQALVAAGRPDVKVGFNWAAGASPCSTEPMWSQLRAAGGAAFTSSVGWVGVDVYPGTWSPPAQTVFPTASLVRSTVTNSLRCLRTEHMSTAGLPASVTITVGETGYPTDPDRSEATQAAVLRETISTVLSVRNEYGVTDLRWFSLRDANTGSGQLENGYGLLHDDYTPKPAFAAYQQLIAADGE